VEKILLHQKESKKGLPQKLGVCNGKKKKDQSTEQIENREKARGKYTPITHRNERKKTMFPPARGTGCIFSRSFERGKKKNKSEGTHRLKGDTT